MSAVEAGGAAEAAGLRAGDILLAVAGNAVLSVRHAADSLRNAASAPRWEALRRIERHYMAHLWQPRAPPPLMNQTTDFTLVS